MCILSVCVHIYMFAVMAAYAWSPPGRGCVLTRHTPSSVGLCFFGRIFLSRFSPVHVAGPARSVRGPKWTGTGRRLHSSGSALSHLIRRGHRQSPVPPTNQPTTWRPSNNNMRVWSINWQRQGWERWISAAIVSVSFPLGLIRILHYDFILEFVDGMTAH